MGKSANFVAALAPSGRMGKLQCHHVCEEAYILAENGLRRQRFLSTVREAAGILSSVCVENNGFVFISFVLRAS